jgi:hypothetical protein
MSSLFEECAYCGKETAGSLFCSDPCRLATLPSPKCDGKQSIKANPALGTGGQTASIEIDSVESDLEIVGASPAEIQQIFNESHKSNRRELTQYETAFEQGRGRGKK